MLTIGDAYIKYPAVLLVDLLESEILELLTDESFHRVVVCDTLVLDCEINQIPNVVDLPGYYTLLESSLVVINVVDFIILEGAHASCGDGSG